MPLSGLSPVHTRISCGMARLASQPATVRASSPLSGRNPWSTVSAQASPPRCRAQRCATRMSARLSDPPETATAITGRASKPPSASSVADSSAIVSGAVGTRLSPAQALLLRRGVLSDGGPRFREIVIELRQGEAGVLLLIGTAEGHAKLQQIIGRLGAFRIALVAFGEGARRFEEPAARVIGFAEPVLRIARHRVRRVLLDKGFQRRLGGRKIGRA